MQLILSNLWIISDSTMELVLVDHSRQGSVCQCSFAEVGCVDNYILLKQRDKRTNKENILYRLHGIKRQTVWFLGTDALLAVHLLARGAEFLVVVCCEPAMYRHAVHILTT